MTTPEQHLADLFVEMVEMRSIDIWRVRDGMFVEHWDELNLMQVFQQIGALPSLTGPLAQP